MKKATANVRKKKHDRTRTAMKKIDRKIKARKEQKAQERDEGDTDVRR